MKLKFDSVRRKWIEPIVSPPRLTGDGMNIRELSDHSAKLIRKRGRPVAANVSADDLDLLVACMGQCGSFF